MGKICNFRFLGFYEKNLTPKKCILRGKNEKIKKIKGVYGTNMKSLFYESMLIF